MAKTGYQNPHKIPPWTISQLQTIGAAGRCAAATAKHTRGLHNQETLLDQVRDSNQSYALIVLDACRYDYFHSTFSNDLVGDIQRVASGGRDTFEYLQNCWPDTYDVPYVSAAVPVNNDRIDFDDTGVHHLYNGYQPCDHLQRIDDVWKEAWDPSLGACPPEPVLAQALQYRGARDLVVHFQQPHTPYIGDTKLLGETDSEAALPGRVSPIDKPIWNRVENGEVSDDELRAAYECNVERVRPTVLRAVDELLRDFDRVVVTADHGEALGEYGVYAHPRTPHHPKVRVVPWVEVAGLTAEGREAADSVDVAGCETFGVGRSRDADEALRDRLDALGYA